MPRYPKLKVADRSAFPPNIRIPDTLIYASVVFALKINLHRHDVDAELYAWFSSRGMSFSFHRHGRSVRDVVGKNRRDCV